MLDFPKKPETYVGHFWKTNNKQLVVASCLDELTGDEQIDKNLEEKLRQCVYRSFDSSGKILDRLDEMFPDLKITESKL